MPARSEGTVQRIKLHLAAKSKERHGSSVISALLRVYKDQEPKMQMSALGYWLILQ